jgi:hypothetical protein
MEEPVLLVPQSPVLIQVIGQRLIRGWSNKLTSGARLAAVRKNERRATSSSVISFEFGMREESFSLWGEKKNSSPVV